MRSLNTKVSATLLCLTALTVSAQQLSSGDKEFLENAAKGGMQEVHMGKLGIQRGSSPAVKKYSQRLVDDHKKANQELMALAKRKGLSLPSDSAHGTNHSEANAIANGGTQGSTGPGRQASSPESDSKSASERSKVQDHSAMSGQGSASLAGKSGSDFDKEFARLAVADHEKDVAEFEKAAGSVSDADVKAWANKTLPTLRAHLKEAQNLNP